MVLVIDNYDSFTYNLVQYIGELGVVSTVYRNDALSLTQIAHMQPSKIIISPGPCTPKEAGISVGLVKEFSPTTPILGVCLGHQSIGEAFGGTVVSAPVLKHGKTSLIHHSDDILFKGVENPFEATRYHSLVVERDSLPTCFNIIATSQDDNQIMAIKHKLYPVWGVQFHPESILTRSGKTILANFLGV